MSEKKTTLTKPRGKLWKWFKRLTLSFLVVLLLIGVFHQPLLRWTLQTVVPKFAKRVNYELQWKVEGDVWSELGFKEVKVTGPEDSPLRSLEIRDFNALYSLPKLYSQGLGEFLASVKLEGATMELDLTIPSSEKKLKKEKTKEAKEGFPDFWVGGLELRDINLKLITQTGVIELENFTLTLAEEQVGEISFDRMIIPQAKIAYGSAKGETFLKNRAVSFKNLGLTDDLVLYHLVIALADFTTAVVGYDVDLESQGARVQLHGKATQLKSSPNVEAELSLQNFTERSLLPWVEIPNNMAWTAPSVSLKATGEVLKPQALELTLLLEGANLFVQDYLIERATLEAHVVEGGSVEIRKLELGTGENHLGARATTKLPPTWQELKTVDAEIHYDLHAPRVSEFWVVNPLLQASIHAQGEIVLENSQPAAGLQKVKIENFAMRDIRVQKLESNLQLAPKKIRVESLLANLDALNQLEFRGDYTLPPNQQVKGDLSLALQQLPNALGRLGVIPPEQLEEASVLGNILMDLKLDDVIKKDYSSSWAEVQLSIDSVVTTQLRIPKASLNLELKNNRAYLKTLNATLNERDQISLSAQIDLAGKMAFESALDLKVVDASTITRFLSSDPEQLPASGSLSLKANAAGDVKDLQEKSYKAVVADVQLVSPGLKWGEAALKGLKIGATVKDETVTLQSLSVALEETQGIEAKGWFELSEAGKFDAALKVQLPKLTSLNPWLANFKQEPIESGSLQLQWSGKGEVKTKDVLGKADLELKNFKTKAIPKPIQLTLKTDHDLKTAQISPLNLDFGPFHLEMKAAISEDLLNIETLKLTSEKRLWLNAQIQVPLRLRKETHSDSTLLGKKPLPIDPERVMLVKVKSERISIPEIFKNLGMSPPVKGAIELDIDLQGKFSELRGDILAKAYQVQAEATEKKLRPADATLEARIEPNRLVGTLEILQKPLQPLKASVDLPISLEKLANDPSSLEKVPLKAQVTLPNSDLAVVQQFVPVIKSIRGNASMDVSLGGTLKSPTWQGAIRVSVPDANFTLAQLPEIKNFQGEILFRDRTVQLSRISTSLAGGQVSLTGQIDAQNLQNPSLDLRLSATEALLVRDETMSLRANADLTCRGTLEQSEVNGSIDLVRGRVFKEIEFLPLSLPNQLPPPPPAVRQGAAPGKVSLPPPLDQWRFNIAIRTKDHIRLLGNVLNGGVSVNLKAHGTGSNPILEGEANLEGARLRLPFSRLAFSRGRVIFSADKFLQPELDIQGDAVISQYEVMVSATGSAFNPTLRMSSSPPLSEGDIATLLATGSTSGDLRSSEGMAANRAAFLLISQTYRKLFNKTQPVRYDDEPPKLSFNFSLLNTGSSQRSVSAIYELSPNLQAIGTMGENGTFRGLLYYLVRFR